MSFRGVKKELIISENEHLKARIKLLEERIEELKEDRNELRTRLEATQDALIFKESPQVYYDQKFSEKEKNLEDDLNKEERIKLAKYNTMLISETEGPTFKDAEDMTDQLEGVIFKSEIKESQPSIHGNDES